MTKFICEEIEPTYFLYGALGSHNGFIVHEKKEGKKPAYVIDSLIFTTPVLENDELRHKGTERAPHAPDARISSIGKWEITGSSYRVASVEILEDHQLRQAQLAELCQTLSHKILTNLMNK